MSLVSEFDTDTRDFTSFKKTVHRIQMGFSMYI